MFTKHIEYIHDNPNHYWFKAKVYGCGWIPATWEGWSVVGVYLTLTLLFAMIAYYFAFTFQAVLLMLIFPYILLISLLTWICYRTGEPLRWSWGYPDKNKK